VRTYLKENHDLCAEIDKKIRDLLLPPSDEQGSESDSADAPPLEA